MHSIPRIYFIFLLLAYILGRKLDSLLANIKRELDPNLFKTASISLRDYDMRKNLQPLFFFRTKRRPISHGKITTQRTEIPYKLSQFRRQEQLGLGSSHFQIEMLAPQPPRKMELLESRELDGFKSKRAVQPLLNGYFVDPDVFEGGLVRLQARLDHRHIDAVDATPSCV